MQLMILIKQHKIFDIRSKSLNIEKSVMYYSMKIKHLFLIFSPYEIRAYNDQLLQLERAFINPLGQGEDYTDYK